MAEGSNGGLTNGNRWALAGLLGITGVGSAGWSRLNDLADQIAETRARVGANHSEFVATARGRIAETDRIHAEQAARIEDLERRVRELEQR